MGLEDEDIGGQTLPQCEVVSEGHSYIQRMTNSSEENDSGGRF